MDHCAGRKRTLSFSNSEPTSKLPKLLHSPVPTPSARIVDLAHQPQRISQPNLPIAVLAATILYTAFRHLDHWPAPLVKAYAEDMFGPRAWVDDPRCKWLVQNLALVHSEDEVAIVSSLTVDASLVTESYRYFTVDMPPPPPPQGGDYAIAANADRSESLSSDVVSVMDEALERGRSDDSNGHGSSPNEVEDGNDSDSGDEDEHIMDAAAMDMGKDDSGDSSSSGEDGEEVVLTNNSRRKIGARMPLLNERGYSTTHNLMYPLGLVNLNLQHVRQRFFGTNREFAQDQIASALEKRLDTKSKQNSGLLQRLPDLLTIPQVRMTIANNLTKWLQSPALAGLARALFAATVDHMKNVDPPLPDDLRAIDTILAMKLKANQLNTHIENVTAVARKIPTSSVVRHMYSALVREELELSNPAGAIHLKMIGAIHGVVPPQVSYDAIASTLLTMLVFPPEQNGTKYPRGQLVKKLRRIIRSMATEFASSFDGGQLVDAFFSLDVRNGPWSATDEEDKARLMFQCITLSAAAIINDSSNRGSKELFTAGQIQLRETLMSAKKLMLTWCCTDYGPRYSGRVRKGLGTRKDDEPAGAGPPDFLSALGSSLEEKIPPWLNTMRCLLFAEDADSELMRKFMIPNEATGEEDPDWADEAARIQLCCDYGGDVDDDQLWIVIKSSMSTNDGLAPAMGVQLLENMIECCAKGRHGTLLVGDPLLVWELYNLVEYIPPPRHPTPVSPDVPASGDQNRDIPR
jgi:integrator complex subunit 1